ncbi:unnamed protein product [Boreogadus saida]
MASTIRQVLQHSLEDLTKDELKKFRASLLDPRPVEHFVDQHRSSLIQGIRRFPPIMDKLLELGVLTQEEYEAIMVIPNPHEQARHLYNGALTSSGTRGNKDIFLSVLEELEDFLIQDLRRS